MTSTWEKWLQKLEDLSTAPDKLNHACREARDFASHFRVFYKIFMFIVEAVKSVLSACTHDGLVLRQPSQSIHISREAQTFRRRFRIPYVFSQSSFPCW